MKTMQEKINDAVARASAVVNGFAVVRDQQARDVMLLAGHIARLEAEKKAAAGIESPENVADFIEKVFSKKAN